MNDSQNARTSEVRLHTDRSRSVPTGPLDSFVRWQFSLSRAFDRLLDERYRIDGCKDFVSNFVPRHARCRAEVWDVGGGRTPLSAALKDGMEWTTVGLDIDLSELQEAPSGTYDRIVPADITRYRGEGSADMVICQSLLEHVENVEQALEGMATILKPGGLALLFVPSRFAVYTFLGRLCPEKLKRILLRRLVHRDVPFYPFPAYYDRCTPGEFAEMARRTGFELDQQQFYYASEYFMFLTPLHIAWRVWQIAARQLLKDQAAETFALCLRKRSDS